MTSTRVTVHHWKNTRQLSVEEGGSVAFHVTLSCGECSTCASREHHVRSMLARTSVPHRWETRYSPYGQYIVFPAAGAASLEEAARFINGVLGLGIELSRAA